MPPFSPQQFTQKPPNEQKEAKFPENSVQPFPKVPESGTEDVDNDMEETNFKEHKAYDDQCYRLCCAIARETVHVIVPILSPIAKVLHCSAHRHTGRYSFSRRRLYCHVSGDCRAFAPTPRFAYTKATNAGGTTGDYRAFAPTPRFFGRNRQTYRPNHLGGGENRCGAFTLRLASR
jgi:hypothetical protein